MMSKEEILSAVTTIARDVFDNSTLVLTESTTANDVEEWDSLTHIQLIVSVEKHFRVKFTSREIAGFQTVGDLCSSISSKQA